MYGKQTAVPKPEPIYYLKTTGKAIHYAEAVKGREKRSRFWKGIANAMAEQWGILQ